MPQYLLLRDNKQSGPYSFEELTAKGLKAYDLIWIEGKSAAWRYPSEIDELKPFSPVVEEQPYDRFYKRQSSAIKQADNASTKPQEVINPAQVRKNPEIKSTPSRRVVVILPGGQRWDKQQEPVVFHHTVENKIQKPELPRPATQKPVGLDDFPEMLPSAKKLQAEEHVLNFKAGKRKPGTMARILSATFFLLIMGVILGWAYNYTATQKKNEFKTVTPTQTVKIDDKPTTIYNNENIRPVSNELIGNENYMAENQAYTDSTDSTVMSVAPESVRPVVKKQVKQKAAEAEITDKTETVADLPVVKNEEPAKIPAENDDTDKKAAKKNINELIRVSNNDFKIGPFGGISDLELKVTNNSAYPVDLVVVEVKYMLANKKEFKTENIYFKNLSPGATQMKEAPKSPRGITVSSKVALITSKALGMYQASL